FQQKFGSSGGNAMVLGVQTDALFEKKNFEAYARLIESLKKIDKVENILSINDAITLSQDSTKKLSTQKVFDFAHPESGSAGKEKLDQLPIFNGLLYNKETDAYLMMISIERTALNSKERIRIVDDIVQAGETFKRTTNIDVHYSG